MERRYYKPILPAAAAAPPDKTGGKKEPEQTVPKRRRIATACEECRSRKVACDGNHPCASCADRKVACVFRKKDSGLQGRLQEHVDLLQQLATGPETDALEMLRRLRASGDVGSVLASCRGAMSDKVRPSFLETARAVSPPSASSLEFELASLHPHAYPMLAPVDLASIRIPTPASSRSAPGEPPQLLLGPPAAAPASALATDYAPFPIRGRVAPGAVPSVAGPLRAPALCDDRLHRVRMDYWTRVPIGDDFAARVLSSFLVRDHPILGLFDADLFLDDLVEKRLDFCSPLLVSALMFHACHSYHAVDVRSVALARLFLAETEMLWQSERSADSLNTLVAIQLYCMMITAQGKDEQTPALVLEGRCMAERMQLFGVRPHAALAGAFATLPPKWKRATAHTAWGVHNWLTHRYCFYTGKSIPHPPIFPVPGHIEPAEMLGAPWPAHPLPAYMGSTFTALCHFWAIVQEVSTVYYFEETDVPLMERVSVAFAEAKYRKLLAWSDSLASEARRCDQRPAPAHVLLLHMYYHCVVLDLFRPFLGRPTAHRLVSFSSHDSSPSQIFAASLKQLKRLVLMLHLHRPPVERSSFLLSTLIHLFAGLLHNTNDQEWRFYFILCLALGSQLGVSFRALGPVLQGSLVMAVRRGALTNKEALELSKTYAPAAPAPEKPESVRFVLDLDLAMTARQDAVADALAQAFDDLRLFGEWVNEEGGDEDDEKGPGTRALE